MVTERETVAVCTWCCEKCQSVSSASIDCPKCETRTRNAIWSTPSKGDEFECVGCGARWSVQTAVGTQRGEHVIDVRREYDEISQSDARLFKSIRDKRPDHE